MTRQEAIEILAADLLARLARPVREQVVLEWWALAPGDLEWAELPESVQAELQAGATPSDANHPRYDPIVMIAMRASLLGTINSFLTEELGQLGHEVAVEVVGEVEPLAACPICDYRTLGRHGEYEICAVCYWEDDGGPAEPDSQRHSPANRMSPAEAHANYQRFGAVEAPALQHVRPDRKRRYARG